MEWMTPAAGHAHHCRLSRKGPPAVPACQRLQQQATQRRMQGSRVGPLQRCRPGSHHPHCGHSWAAVAQLWRRHPSLHTGPRPQKSSSCRHSQCRPHRPAALQRCRVQSKQQTLGKAGRLRQLKPSGSWAQPVKRSLAIRLLLSLPQLWQPQAKQRSLQQAPNKSQALCQCMTTGPCSQA